MIPFRSDSGFSNHGPGEPLHQFGIIDPSRYHCWFTDFHRSEGVTAATANDWTVTKDGSPTVALADADGGVLALTDGGTDTHQLWIQKLGESFMFDAAKKLAVIGRFKVSDATQMGFIFGLQITDTSPLDASHGIYFTKADGSATLNAKVSKDSVTATGAVTTMVADTYVEAAIVYRGSKRIVHGPSNTTYYDFETYYKDSAGKWVQAGTIQASSEAPDDEELTISFGHQNGDGTGAKVSSYDYMMFVRER